MISDTRRYLGEIPELMAQLPVFRLPGSKPADPERRSGTQDPARPPLDVNVFHLEDRRLKEGWLDFDPGVDPDRHGVFPNLWLWAHMVEQEMMDADYQFESADGETVKDLCDWLTFHLQWIDEHHDDFGRSIRKMRNSLRMACGEKDDETLPCPRCGWFVEPRDGGTWWRCTGCDQTWARPAEEARLLREAEDVVTLKRAAAQLGLSVKTLHEWKGQGLISSIGKDRRGNLYSLRALKSFRDTRGQRGA